MTMKHIALAGAAVASLAIAGCERQDARTAAPLAALPLTEIATGPLPLAPGPEALPRAPAPRLGRITQPRTHYGYIDRAYEISDVFYDSPPDYGFYYDEAEPWVWRTEDDYYLVSEPFDDGWRYYYYEPGAYSPFLIRDPFYSYGFDRGALVVVYDSGGRVLPYDLMYQRTDYAGRYLSRGELLYRAAISQPRRAIAVSQWAAERGDIRADRLRLVQQQQTFPEWRAYRQAREVEDRTQWADERARRKAWAAQANEQLSRPMIASGHGRQGERGRTASGPLVAPPIQSLDLPRGRNDRRPVIAQGQVDRARLDKEGRHEPRAAFEARRQAVEHQGAEQQARGRDHAVFDQRRVEAQRLKAQAEQLRLRAETRGRQARDAERAQIQAQRLERARAQVQVQRAAHEQVRAQDNQRRAAAMAERASRAQAQAQVHVQQAEQARAQGRERQAQALAAARQGANAAAEVPAQGQEADKKAKRGKGGD